MLSSASNYTPYIVANDAIFGNATLYVGGINLYSVQNFQHMPSNQFVDPRNGASISRLITYSPPLSGTALPNVSKNDLSRIRSYPLVSVGSAQPRAATALPYASNFLSHHDASVHYVVESPPVIRTNEQHRSKPSQFSINTSAGVEVGNDLPFTGSAMPYGATLSSHAGGVFRGQDSSKPIVGSVGFQAHRQPDHVAAVTTNRPSENMSGNLILRRPLVAAQGLRQDSAQRRGAGAPTPPNAFGPVPAARPQPPSNSNVATRSPGQGGLPRRGTAVSLVLY